MQTSFKKHKNTFKGLKNLQNKLMKSSSYSLTAIFISTRAHPILEGNQITIFKWKTSYSEEKY